MCCSLQSQYHQYPTFSQSRYASVEHLKYPKHDTDSLGKTAEQRKQLLVGTEIKWFCKWSVPLLAKIQSSAEKEWAGEGQKALNHTHLSKHKLSGWDIKSHNSQGAELEFHINIVSYKWNRIETLS